MRLSGQPDNSGAELLRRRGGPPLYVQVSEQIVDGIRDAGLRPGDRVPSEPELVRAYGISRATAGKALEQLELAGIVRREQGRGTFVASPSLVQRRPQLGSFSESVRRQGHESTHRLLAFEPLDAAADEPLRTWFGDDVALARIVRLRRVDGQPVGLHRVLLPCSNLERAGVDRTVFADPHASLYALLDAAGLHIVAAEEHLQAVVAQPAEADLLEVAPGTPLMRVVRVSWDATGRPAEATDARYVGDRFDYSVALDRPAIAADQTKGEKDDEQTHRRGRPDRAARPHGGRVREVG